MLPRRVQSHSQTQPEDFGAGKNPTYGATIHYNLTSVPEDEIQIEILDEDGQVIRRFKEKPEDDSEEDSEDEGPGAQKEEGLPKKEGINRFYWDLRHEKTKEVKLRTKPLEHSHVQMPDKGWRALGDGGRVNVLAAPGTYTVKLIVGDEELTQELVVKKDPSSTASVEEVTAQVETLLEIRDDINDVADMIHSIEWVRKQIY